MFIETLFTRTKIRKQPKGPPVDEWIKKLWHIIYMCNGIVFALLKEQLERHYTKKNKPDTERQILHNITYIWSLK
jgi:hypothetical protein